MEKNIETKETSREILFEWYKEKGVSFEDLEKLEKRRKEEEEGEEDISFSSPEKSLESLKEKEDEKKLEVKAEVKKLLILAETGGLEEAIKEAQKKADPLVLDVFHDALAMHGAYKKFIGK